VPALNALANASIVYDQEQHPWLSGMGMYDPEVDRSADEAYRNQLKVLLLPRLLQYLEQRVARGHEGGDLYHNFRVYMMFNKLEHMDKALVEEWFVSDWKETMQGEASYRQALVQHMQSLLALELQPQELNSKLVAQSRKILLRVPVHQRIYSRIRTQPEYRERVDLLNLLGESVRSAFRMSEAIQQNLTIPFMFTKEGYDSIDLSPESPMVSDIVRERWVLSDDATGKVDFIKDDLDDISEKVKKLYLTEYAAHWEKVLKSLDVVEFKSLDHAQEVLASFVDPVDSPLHAVLQVTAENTRLSVQLAQDLNDDHGEGKAGAVTAALASKFKGTVVDQQFRPVNVLLRESKKKPAPVKAIDSRLVQLKEFITQLSIAPEPGKKAFELAKARVSAGSGNAITNLSRFSASQPEPVKRWLQVLSDQSWKIILSAAHGHVNQEWKGQVYTFYRNALAGRYPLKRSSDNEMALLDFSEFFKPEGRMDKFFLTYIRPFVNTGKRWSNKVVDKRSIGFSNATLKQIRIAQALKNIYFRATPEAPALSFQLKPYRMNKNDARFWIDVGQNRIQYNHGPKFWKDFNWSAKGETNRIRLVFEDLDGELHEQSFEGPWSWFRLRDLSAVKKTDKSNVYRINFKVASGDNPHSIEYLIKAKSVNNPFNGNLLGAFKCPGAI
jgi:type VI secretion system protein ImpL